jgi:hypothetical protein
MCDHPREYLQPTGRRYTHRCGICGEILTSRQLGLNPRALGTNPRAKARNRYALRNFKRGTK